MKLLSWNVQGAFPKFGNCQRIKDQIWYLDKIAKKPDIIALNEVNRFQHDLWIEELTKIGYSDIVHTLDWAKELGESNVPPHQDFDHVNGNLIAVHETSEVGSFNLQKPSIRNGPWEDAVLKDWSTNFPEKILNATVQINNSTVDLWNIRAIPGNMWGEEKIKILENVFNRIKKSEFERSTLTGDFNSPKGETPGGTVVPWGLDRENFIRGRWVEAELMVLDSIENLGMVDVFRNYHGYGDLDVLDVSHATQTDEPLRVPPDEVRGKRFDHLLASKELNPGNCYYEQAGFFCSDHAPLIAEFKL
ncbi:MAG: hypothetical protein ACOCR6_00555 [archaeon]